MVRMRYSILIGLHINHKKTLLPFQNKLQIKSRKHNYIKRTYFVFSNVYLNI